MIKLRVNCICIYRLECSKAGCIGLEISERTQIDEKEEEVEAEDAFNLIDVAVEEGQRVGSDDLEEDLGPVEYEDLEDWPENDGDWEEEDQDC